MSATPNDFETKQGRFGPRYVLTDGKAFRPDAWVTALLAINEAQTFGEQQNAIGQAILKVAGSSYGLTVLPRQRLRYVDHASVTLDARFSLLPDEIKLRYLKAGSCAVGYQTPDELTRNPAFAVLNEGRSGVREVIHDADDILTVPLGVSVSDIVTQILTASLDYRYPGFDLPIKLEAALQT